MYSSSRRLNVVNNRFSILLEGNSNRHGVQRIPRLWRGASFIGMRRAMTIVMVRSTYPTRRRNNSGSPREPR